MNETWSEFRDQCRSSPPSVSLVLGSGMGPVADRVRKEATISYGDIPGVPTSTVSGHKGCLSLGSWGTMRLLLFEGRLHYYEGHSWEVVTRPLELSATLGAKRAVLTSAVGGIRRDLVPGSIVLLSDHFEWNHSRAWRSPGLGGIAGSRPSPYSEALSASILEAATTTNMEITRGVYAAMTGPNYETPAEVRALEKCGADVVGMSTSREVERATAVGIECAVLACVANLAAGISPQPLSHIEVLEVVAQQADRLAQLLDQLWKDLDSD